MIITTILPVSRIQYLDRVLESLLVQTYKPQNLLVIHDGTDEAFIEVRNRIVGLDFDSVLCVQSRNDRLAYSIPERRVHITEIHNHFRELIENADWIFSIEDDGILPPNALERLLSASQAHGDVGMISGVELGRWGVPYVGAWTVDNVQDVTEMVSIENRTSETPFVEPIDACGLYCALINAKQYKSHEFITDNGLGPDVNLGLYMRKQGLNNYIDWGVLVTHLTYYEGQEIEIYPTDESRVVKLKLLYDNIWQSQR